MSDSSEPFICGVIEGFYGRPWSARQRRQLFGWMQAWDLNTYLYAPKDDLKHRVRWRELYEGTAASELQALVADCQARPLNFVYALAPGLDIRYADEREQVHLKEKLAQLMAL